MCAEDRILAGDSWERLVCCAASTTLGYPVLPRVVGDVMDWMHRTGCTDIGRIVEEIGGTLEGEHGFAGGANRGRGSQVVSMQYNGKPW